MVASARIYACKFAFAAHRLRAEISFSQPLNPSRLSAVGKYVGLPVVGTEFNAA